MNAGLDAERLIAQWLVEEAPGRAPDRVFANAAAEIDRTRQRRFAETRLLPIPWIEWRPKTMFERVAASAVVAVLAIGTLTLGASLLLLSNDLFDGACPPTLDESAAVDSTVPGLSQAERAWGIAGGRPTDRVRAGRIAAFAFNEATDERTVVAIDPVSGDRCVLVRNVSGLVQSPVTQLDWSPSGDALAIGLVGEDSSEGEGTGQLLIWTPERLLRIWSGAGTPYVEWSPDGRSIATWNGTANAVILYADGTPDRTYDVRPVGPSLNWPNGLDWSPDGSRWLITTDIAGGGPVGGPTVVSIVELDDGRATPIDLGTEWLGAVGWIDDSRVLLKEWEEEPGGPYRYLDVPIAAPASFSIVPMPDQGGGPRAFSPDRRRAAYPSVPRGRLSIVDVTGGAPGAPIAVEPGAGVIEMYSISWSPDGSRLLFHTDETVAGQPADFRMWVVNADGTGLREISRGNVIAVDDPWQPVAQGR